MVLNALNPVITEWRKNALSLAYAAIAAAEGNGATLLFPGSVWNYGRGMPPVLDESTPMQPTTRKGGMRVEIEQRIHEACDRGMRAIVLRAGDFFGGGSGSWFDLVIAKDIGRGRLTYPGPLNVEHEWAYLPDFAATLVRLAEQRATFGACETFGFPGHAVTGQEFVATIEAVTKSKFTLRPMSWWMIKTFGQLLAMGRELSELEYLWRVPHRISGDKLKAAIGEIPHTPLPEAIALLSARSATESEPGRSVADHWSEMARDLIDRHLDVVLLRPRPESPAAHARRIRPPEHAGGARRCHDNQ